MDSELGFLFAKKNPIGKEFLLELDTSLATLTSGWRTILLLQQEQHPPNTPHLILPMLHVVRKVKMPG